MFRRLNRLSKSLSLKNRLGLLFQNPFKAKSPVSKMIKIGVLVIALLWSVYTFAGQISAQVPQLAGPLDSYTRTVDSGRDWLDGQVKTLLVKLDELAAASEE